MSVATNFKHPLRTGYLKLAHSGVEKFGTVVRTGRNRKTCTVEVSNYSFNYKYKRWFGARKKFHCHDEFEEACVGDKVIIRSCLKVSPIKSFYVRSIVLPIGRNSFYQGKFSKDELDALEYNQKLRDNYKNEVLL